MRRADRRPSAVRPDRRLGRQPPRRRPSGRRDPPSAAGRRRGAVPANDLHRQRRGGDRDGEGDRRRQVRHDRQCRHHPAGAELRPRRRALYQPGPSAVRYRHPLLRRARRRPRHARGPRRDPRHPGAPPPLPGAPLTGVCEPRHRCRSWRADCACDGRRGRELLSKRPRTPVTPPIPRAGPRMFRSQSGAQSRGTSTTSPSPARRGCLPTGSSAIRRETRLESVRRSVCIHMKLTVQTFLTLDGVMQAPGGPEEDPSDAFTHGGWQAPFPDQAVGEFVTELNSHASAFLFGRRTFDIFRGYWPDQTDPANAIATAINSLPKYVVSNSLSEADATWRGEHPDTARLLTGDVVAAVQALKDEPGDELQIWGSSQLLQTLLQHELVDRFRLMTFPLVLGSGRRLFNDGILPATMRPVDLTVTDLGIVIGTYEPAGPVRHGQM